MANFERGNLVIGTRSGHGVANSKVLCVVRECFRWSSLMRVEIVGGKKYYANLWYKVNKSDFDACTVEEYLERYPNAIIDYGKFINITQDGTSVYHMDMSQTYAITEEERAALVAEMGELFQNYGMKYKNEALDKIVDKWVQEKGWIIELFKKHPNYNGKYQITFDEDYQRSFDKKAVRNFAYWVETERFKILAKNKAKITAFELGEVKRICERLEDVIEYMDDLKCSYNYRNTVINGKTQEEIRGELEYFRKIKRIYKDAEIRGKIRILSGEAYSLKAIEVYDNLHWLYNALSEELNDSNITDSQADAINKRFNVKAVGGQKLSRIINKIMTYTGMADLPDYNKQFAKYSDAVNPVAIKRHTILSVHPIDYLRMSNGNSWTSCHSVERNGAHCSGTLSYMMDRSSFVYYTVDSSYAGDEYEWQDKITRCMFHMGYEKLIQGRLYPQSTDGDNATYLEVRNIVRRVISAAMGIADDWTIRKGTSACVSEIITKGTHYPDYSHSSGCNVSRIKRKDGYVDHTKITVGTNPFCIICGKEHRNTSSRLRCGTCW